MSRRRWQINPDNRGATVIKIKCDRHNPPIIVATYRVPSETGRRLSRMEPGVFNGRPAYFGPNLAMVPMVDVGEEIPVSSRGDMQRRKVRWECPDRECRFNVTLAPERADWVIHTALARGERLIALTDLAATL